HAGRAVAGRDVLQAPFLYARALLMSEMSDIDQDAPRFLCLYETGEQFELRFEILIGHRGSRIFPINPDDARVVIPQNLEKYIVVSACCVHKPPSRSSFGRSDAADPLVPTLVVKPLLECLKLDLGIPLSQLTDACLKSSVIEPMKHLEVFLLRWDWHRYEFDWLTEHSAEDFGSLRICQLAAGNLQLHANEVLRALERKRHESANVIRRDCLI